MASMLPRFIALQFNGRYLQFAEEEGDLHGFLRFSGNEVVNPYSKFQVERATSSEELVHIKSCYNNKYLVRKVHQGQTWIVAGIDEPEEDQSKKTCTLLRPLDGAPDRFAFEVEGSNPKNFLSSQQMNGHNYLISHTVIHSITVIDMESLAILPRFFTLKGDNGKYLRSRTVNGRPHMEFTSDNIKDLTVRYEAITLPDGNVRLRSLFYNRFWGMVNSDNQIWANFTNATRETLWKPIRLGHNATGNKFIAIQSVSTRTYCKRDRQDIIYGTAVKVEPQAELEVEELVRAREIYDVCYRTGDGKIYDARPGIILTKDVVNRSPTATQTGEVPFTYTETHTETWDSSHSWKVGVSTTIRAGIPFVANKEISIEAAYEGQVSWGEIKETSTEIGTKVEVEVPPMTRLKVGMVVAKAAIDVPFSYTQRDTLLDGDIVTYRMHDGCFRGVNTHVSYDIKEEPLISSTSLTAPAAKL